MSYKNQIVPCFLVVVAMSQACSKHKNNSNPSSTTVVNNNQRLAKRPSSSGSTSTSSFSLVEPTILPMPVSLATVQTPCPFRGGLVPHPNQGSGRCTGNLLTSVSLATIGASLVHNSEFVDDFNGFGAGWNLSFRHRLQVGSDGLHLTILLGDRTPLTFTASSMGGPWTSDDIRITNDKIIANGSNYDLIQRNGVKTTFAPSSSSPDFVIHHTEDANGNVTDVTWGTDAFGPYELWSMPFGQSIKLSMQTISAGTTPYIVVRYIYDSYGQRYRIDYTADTATSKLDATSIVNPDGSATSPQYIAGTHLIGAKSGPTGYWTLYAYYANGPLRAVVDHFNWTTNFAYTSTSVTATSAYRTVSETFNSSSGIIHRDIQGVTTDWVRDSNNRVTTKTDHLGSNTTLTYSNSDLLPATVTSPRQVDTYTYDANGNVLTWTEATSGHSVAHTYTYNALQQLTSSTTNGLTKSVQRDSHGNPTGLSIGGDNSLFSVTYDSAGQATAQSDEWGLVSYSQYGSNGQVASVTDPLSNISTFGSNGGGLITSGTSSGSPSFASSYDLMTRLNSLQKSSTYQTNYGTATQATLSQNTTQVTKNGTVREDHYTVNNHPVSSTQQSFSAWGEMQSLDLNDDILNPPSGSGSSFVPPPGAAGGAPAAGGGGATTIPGFIHVADAASCIAQSIPPTPSSTATATPTATATATVAPTNTPFGDPSYGPPTPTATPQSSMQVENCTSAFPPCTPTPTPSSTTSSTATPTPMYYYPQMGSPASSPAPSP